MARYLVVAHQTAASAALADALRRITADDPGAGFELLVPATQQPQLPGREGGDAAAIARQRADQAVASLARAGIDVARSFVGLADPLSAMEEAIRAPEQAFDGIVVSTLPLGLSRWLGLDLPDRARRRFGLPVIHVVSEPGAGQPAVSDRDADEDDCRHAELISTWVRSSRLLNEIMTEEYRCIRCGTVVEPGAAALARAAPAPSAEARPGLALAEGAEPQPGLAAVNADHEGPVVLSLGVDEAQLLHRVLTDYLGTLRELVHRTDNYEWRQGYKCDEELVKAIIARLESRAGAEPFDLVGPAGQPVPPEALMTDVGPSIAPA